MKRKDYKKPTTNVVKLQFQGWLMLGSSGSPDNTTSVQDYNWQNEEEE